jgi:hypothetical protein
MAEARARLRTVVLVGSAMQTAPTIVKFLSRSGRHASSAPFNAFVDAAIMRPRAVSGYEVGAVLGDCAGGGCGRAVAPTSSA